MIFYCANCCAKVTSGCKREMSSVHSSGHNYADNTVTMGTIEISTYTVQNYDGYLNVEHMHVCMFIMLSMLEETMTHLFRAV